MTAFIVSACAAKKSALANDSTTTTVTASNTGEAKQALRFVQRVSDNALYQKNVVATKMTFNLKAGSKDITLPASLHMRKDDVIRLQVFIPLLGSEIGRLELTKDYVLIIDRIHKQYIKADYNQIDFLREKGLSFYSLQSLFWNQLFLPGEQKVSESLLKQYNADISTTANLVPVDFRQGAMSFVWSADKTTALIENADITYVSSKHGTTNGITATSSRSVQRNIPTIKSLTLRRPPPKRRKCFSWYSTSAGSLPTATGRHAPPLATNTRR